MNRTKYIVFDTETTDLVARQDDKVDPTKAIVYNIGMTVVDKYGTTYEKADFIVAEVMFGMREQMRNAFYASKIPHYWDKLACGQIKVMNLWDIRQYMLDLIAKYDIHAVVAHNARFDVTALNHTTQVLTETRYTRFLPCDVEVWDTMKFANNTICKQTNYTKFCEQNGYMTKHKTPRPRKTAEVLYRYLTNDVDFVEEHTALADAIIEAYILQRCFATHKGGERVLYPATTKEI